MANHLRALVGLLSRDARRRQSHCAQRADAGASLCRRAVRLTGGRVEGRRAAAGSALLLLCGATLVWSTGCAWTRQRLSHRSSECNQLCEEARSARQQGKTEQADRLLDAAVRRRPTDVETRRELAEELWSGGRQLAAAAEYETLVATSPDDTGLAVRLAEMQLAIGRTDAAADAVAVALRADPNLPEALRLQALVEQRQGRWEASLATYHQLLRMSPDDVSAQIGLAQLHLRRGQAERAAPLLRTALEHPQATLAQRAEAEWGLGLAYAQCGRWQDAAPRLRDVIRSRESTADDWCLLAEAEARTGNLDAANACIDQALLQRPEHAGARELARQIALASLPGSPTVVPAGFRPPTSAATTARLVP